jgi:hypothetical protein
MSKLTDPAWWKAALLRAVYTAIAIAIPYIAAVQFADVPWLMAASAATVGAILSFATSLFGLPESEGVDLPWWLAALERVAKTFGQSLAAGLTGAVLLSDVDWSVVLQAALGAAFISLLRLILATLPADPTPAAVALAQTENGSRADTRKEDPDPGFLPRDSQSRTFP